MWSFQQADPTWFLSGQGQIAGRPARARRDVTPAVGEEIRQVSA